MRVGQLNAYTTLLSGVSSAPTTGAALDLSQGPLFDHAWELDWTDDDPLTIQVDIEGSLDATNFYQLDTYNTVTRTLRYVTDKPIRFIRAKLAALTNNEEESTSVTVRYLGMRPSGGG